MTDGPRHRRPGGLLWHRDFRLLWAGETVSWLGSYMAIVAMPLLAVNVLHASNFAVGALVAAGYLPWLVIGLLAALGAVPCCLLAPLASRGPGLVLYVIGIFMTAVGMVAVNVIVGSLRQAYSPPGMLGRVSATIRFLTAGTSPLGALLGGALAAVISPRGALWVLFAMITAAGLLLLSHSFTRRRDLPAAAAPADSPGSAGAVRT